MSDPVVDISDQADTESDHFWTASNAVSLLRIVLTLPAVWLMVLGPEYVWPTFVIVVIMILSDMLDGYLARRWNEITRWGKVLDPLADKVAIGAITIAMVLFKGLPFWVVAAVLVRDGLILIASLFLVGRRDVVVSSNIWGKLTTLLMSLLLVSFLVDLDFIKPFLLWTCGGLLFVSWLSYLFDFIQIMRRP
ncbi:MAG: CDP-alcohol phosphatidyltransferase family protein [Candidatus Latescibacteria bacterium]|nr:CDP-alcohol phosphatidyltransferase family protein [Candidatus Latescibacterota bacterium]MBT4137683.1 CDP-alcohol phosphatidyltransferase family protein [Candidatus Latescibacterota bacterium]